MMSKLPAPSPKQSLRMRRALLLSALMLGVISLSWSVYFATQGNWAIWPINILSITVAIIAAWLTCCGKVRLASITLFSAVYLILCVFCVFLDIPTPDAPRSNHNYFLVVALFAWLVFKDDAGWLRYGMMLAALVAFIFFASTQWGISTPYALDADVRIPGSWIHNLLVTALLVTLLWVMQTNLAERNAMESDLRKAISAGQLMLHFQPQVGHDGHITGAEALLRWRHPVKGMVPPADFIPLAEQSGLILPVGHWVLGAACAQLQAWSSNPATSHLGIAVNVSASQFKQSDYVNQVISVLDRSGAEPTRLTLELTESMLVNDVEDIIAKMHALKAKGIRLSLDDFGTGYSSLSYLKQLPLDQIKIDRSFVRNVAVDRHDIAIVQTVVKLAHSMQLHVIAEGVETEEQRQFLATLGCHAFQGYLLSKPLPVDAFETFITSRQQITDI